MKKRCSAHVLHDESDVPEEHARGWRSVRGRRLQEQDEQPAPAEGSRKLRRSRRGRVPLPDAHLLLAGPPQGRQRRLTTHQIHLRFLPAPLSFAQNNRKFPGIGSDFSRTQETTLKRCFFFLRIFGANSSRQLKITSNQSEKIYGLHRFG